MDRLKKLVRMLLSYPCRLWNGISWRAAVVDCRVEKTARIQHHSNVRYSEIGRYSYISARASVIHTTVGNFCSIAAGAAIGGGAHDMDAVSTSPVFSSGRNLFGRNLGNHSFSVFRKTTIGSDVWVGNRAIVLQGVTIGDGAVIGAGSVVTKDVEPYTVVAGNPARCIRKRFADETIEALLALRWWEWDDEKLQKYGDYFCDPKELLKRLECET